MRWCPYFLPLLTAVVRLSYTIEMVARPYSLFYRSNSSLSFILFPPVWFGRSSWRWRGSYAMVLLSCACVSLSFSLVLVCFFYFGWFCVMRIWLFFTCFFPTLLLCLFYVMRNRIVFQLVFCPLFSFISYVWARSCFLLRKLQSIERKVYIVCFCTCFFLCELPS